LSIEKKKVEFIKETKLVMRVEQLSTTQTTVIYMGQLVLGNTLKENLEIQVKVASENNGEIFNLPGNSTCASIVIDVIETQILIIPNNLIFILFRRRKKWP